MIDLLIVSSLLYYFYYQGASLKAMKEGKRIITSKEEAIEDETLDSDGVGTEDVRDLLLNGTDMDKQPYISS